jgi:hypothetical protein
MMLVTNGAPTCAGSGGALTSDAMQAPADAVWALASAVATGFPAFVMGVGVTAAGDVDALNALADAGTYPRAHPTTRFYPSTAVDELRLVLTPQIERSCVFPMPEPPPGTGSPRVAIDGLAIPYDETHQNGWAYIDAMRAAFSFYGPACDRILSSWESEVQITFLCLLL